MMVTGDVLLSLLDEEKVEKAEEEEGTHGRTSPYMAGTTVTGCVVEKTH